MAFMVLMIVCWTILMACHSWDQIHVIAMHLIQTSSRLGYGVELYGHLSQRRQESECERACE